MFNLNSLFGDLASFSIRSGLFQLPSTACCCIIYIYYLVGGGGGGGVIGVFGWEISTFF